MRAGDYVIERAAGRTRGREVLSVRIGADVALELVGGALSLGRGACVEVVEEIEE